MAYHWAGLRITANPNGFSSSFRDSISGREDMSIFGSSDTRNLAVTGAGLSRPTRLSQGAKESFVRRLTLRVSPAISSTWT